MKTVFSQKEAGGQWFWHTVADNGKIVADGSEGYNRLDGAIHGYLVSQGTPVSGIDQQTIADFHAKLIRHDTPDQKATYHLTHE